MTIVASLLGGLLLALAALMVWQHRRYLRRRRQRVQDRQPLWYSRGAFHVVTFLRASHGTDVIDSVRKLRDLLETKGRSRVVYAGRAALNVVISKQLPDVAWSAVMVVQYPSREEYDAIAASEEYRIVLGGFERVYAHGMKRSALRNLAIPQLLLAIRAIDWLRGVPSHHPFEPAGEQALPAQIEKAAEFADLDGLRPLGEDSVVIVNLLAPGTREQQAADAAYARSMMGAMAEGGHGPVHLGRAVRVEGDAEFRQVALVDYPGIDYMKAMIGSTFMSRIGAGKQPGDSLAVVTLPILSRL